MNKKYGVAYPPDACTSVLPLVPPLIRVVHYHLLLYVSYMISTFSYAIYVLQGIEYLRPTPVKYSELFFSLDICESFHGI